MVSQYQPEDKSADDGGAKGLISRPGCMYVHYLKGSERPPFPVYLFPVRNRSDLQGDIEAAVADIEGNVQEPLPRGPDGIEWTAYSYMIFVLDRAEAEFLEVKFEHHETGKNHTFLDGARIQDFGNCSVLCYINFRRNKFGDPLGPIRENYRWKVRHLDRRQGAEEPLVSHEDSGTNVGP